MYRTILVPLDDSAFSERALPMATTLAQHLKSKLILTRVASASVFPGADATEAQVQAVREAQDHLSDLASRLGEQGLPVEIAVPYGDAAEEILVEVGLHSAGLVIMCTHGRSGLGRWIYGSTAEQVLHRSPVPVLLVHPTGESMTLRMKPAHTSFLVPLDGSAFAEAALPHASALARAFDGTISLLRVVEPPTSALTLAEASLLPPTSEASIQEAESYLAGMAERLRDSGFSVQTAVREGWPADVIVHQSAMSEQGLIVMATHGRTGVARLLLGSVALQVVRRSSLPVMLVRPAQQTTA